MFIFKRREVDELYNNYEATAQKKDWKQGKQQL